MQGYRAGWIEDCLQSVAQLVSMIIACLRRFRCMCVHSRVHPKMSRRHVTMKKWTKQAFVGNVREFHDAIDIPG